MDFAFSEEQDMLRQSVRDFLTKECGSKVVRKLMESPDSYDPALWKKIADLGWTALGIPETYGGVGGFLDLIVVFEETGRALLPGPFFATMGLAVPALLEAGTEAQKKEVLSAIAAGSARATLAFTEPSGRWDANGIALTEDQIGKTGCQRLGVIQLGNFARAVVHRLAAINQQTDHHIGVLLILFDVVPVCSAEHFPIEVTGVISHRVFAMLGEFTPESLKRRAMFTHLITLHHRAGHNAKLFTPSDG